MSTGSVFEGECKKNRSIIKIWTGGALGADTCFAEQGCLHGFDVRIATFSGHKIHSRPKGSTIHNMEAYVTYYDDSDNLWMLIVFANINLQRRLGSMSDYTKTLLRRNALIGKAVDVIIGVGKRLELDRESEKNDRDGDIYSKGDDNYNKEKEKGQMAKKAGKSPQLHITGGTAWAFQVFVNRHSDINNRMFYYETDFNRWNVWNNGKWNIWPADKPLPIPEDMKNAEAPAFGCVGSREIDESGRKAIKDVIDLINSFFP